jgi:hypothetical protein
MLSDKPLDAALADAVTLGKLPLRRACDERGDKPFNLALIEPTSDLPLSGTRERGPYALSRSVGHRLRLLKLTNRADQRVYEIPAV